MVMTGRWTDAEDASLRTEWASGKTLSEVAESVGRSVSAVQFRRATLGLPRRETWKRENGGTTRYADRAATDAAPRRWTSAEDATLREMWRAGNTVTQIGEFLGRSGKSIDNRSMRLQLPRRHVSSRLRQQALIDDGLPMPAATAGAAHIWTTELDERLRRLHSGRFTVVAIASALGIARSTVQSRIARLGLVRPEATAAAPKVATVERAKRVASAWSPRTVPATTLPAIMRPVSDARTCQWPLTSGRPWRFCGCPVVSRSYCAEHAAVAFRAGSDVAA